MKACCKGCNSPLELIPSIVVTLLPLLSTARTRQELTALPSTITVQAPQSPVSHPLLVPTSPRRYLSRSSRVSLGATEISRAWPLIITRMLWVIFMGRPLSSLAQLLKGARHQDLNHGATVTRRAPYVADRSGIFFRGQSGRIFRSSSFNELANEGLFRIAGANRSGGNCSQGDAHVRPDPL